MAVDTDKNSYTVIFAGLMVVVVGSILAFLASALRPQIQENERFATQQNILYAMGVNENGDDVGLTPTLRSNSYLKMVKPHQMTKLI
jgi:Na+-transporting NADH:ubiquinone oxidoreductase subunit C